MMIMIYLPSPEYFYDNSTNYILIVSPLTHSVPTIYSLPVNKKTIKNNLFIRFYDETSMLENAIIRIAKRFFFYLTIVYCHLLLISQ